jgi:UDP-2,3-diacylglucosamine pyrophosphatase LpxH
MSIVSQDIAFQTWLHPRVTDHSDRWQSGIEHRLAQMRDEAYAVEFDDTSRFVFFSDCHRGDRGRTDVFAPNETLFLYALAYYAEQGFTYVEVGDGDELWQNRRFETVRRAHARTFDLLHRFDRASRLYLLFGNHDIQHRHLRQMTKDGILVRESLRLTHAKRGQSILVFHGHQTDPQNDRFAPISRFTVRNVWRQMLRLGLARGIAWTEDLSQRHAIEKWVIDRVRTGKTRIEQRLVGWSNRQQQMIICGHTHHPASAQYGMAPYFNTGSCVEPNQLTGLEIENGSIALVRWVVKRGETRRELLMPPKRLSPFLAN